MGAICCCCGPRSPELGKQRQSSGPGHRAMNLFLGHRLVGGVCQALRPKILSLAPARVLAMSKRSAGSSNADPGAASPATSPSTSNHAASPGQQPASKRRKLQPIAAGPSSAQTAPASAKAAPAAKPQAKPQPAKADEDGMWMIVGLGNPGAMYDKTRHNIGFTVIDELARQAGIDCRKLEKSAAVGRGELYGKQVLLAKPVTFMNNSGEAVAALARFHRLPPARVLVVADDLDLPTAQVRLRQKGGHGGHNGLRSIIDRLGGTQDFPRIKVGIGRPSGPLPIASYVLMPFSKAERPEVEVAIQESVTLIRSVLALGLEKAASGQRV